MNVSLVLVKTDGSQREVPLRKSVGVIGRQTDCNIRIPSASVSRHHCEVSVDDAGVVSLRDLGSSNGTFVNKQRIEQASVKAGDIISLGGFVFVVKIDGKPSFIDAEDVIEDGLVEAGGASAAESRPTAATAMTALPKPASTPSTPSTPSKPSKPSKPSTPSKPASPSSDDSSVVDFDFLGDDDDDLKKQPKL